MSAGAKNLSDFQGMHDLLFKIITSKTQQCNNNFSYNATVSVLQALYPVIGGEKR